MTEQKRESSMKDTEKNGDDIFNLSRDAKNYLAGFLACAQAMAEKKVEEHTNESRPDTEPNR